ncbi:Enoyl-CoA hydratase / 3-hydroxyacyl-CoA dehydrogenase / 3-hydroxybutyryl-CoA epimerase [hydrothermal vent metagenome]|uniref:enoyl-CoA hydratase n=1 Tax=hydrothermal vent metagenome TaxID=652676 RepID=A0A3B1A0P2_9ZZZZ
MTDKSNNWQRETDAEGIVWLTIDQVGASANTLGRELMEELNNILDELEAQRPTGLVIQSAKANFIVGADIREFTHVKTPDQARELIRRGQAVVNRLEGLRCPTVVLINGFCLGGGLELALGCDYRVADDADSTRLGLPEVRLGIHPGFGGAARLPRLVGATAAMDMMLTGRSLSARAAKKIGLVDHAVPQRHLQRAARELIRTRPEKKQASGLAALGNHALVRPLLARVLRKKVTAKARPEHYPAPYALIDLWRKHGTDKPAVLRAEELSVAQLVTGDTARNLVRVFFLQERLKSQGDKKAFTPQRIHVIGGGVMGGDIAAWCALRGLQVTVQDRNDGHLAQVVKRAARLYKKKLKKPRLIQQALDRLMPDKQGQGLAQADVVIEAIFEDIEAKQNLYREIEPHMKEGALLATNTSSIPLQILGEALSQPDRLVGLHFFNPVAQMQLVEIVTTPDTNPDAAKKAAAFTRHIDRLPLPVNSSPGFLVNRVLMPYLLEAVTLEAEGLAPKVIDAEALKFGMPMGPILLADTVGLDICLSVAEILSKELGVEVPSRLRELVKAGRLGKKSGHGFYRYDKQGKPLGTKAGRGEYCPPDTQDRLIARLLNEALACLREEVVSDTDLLDAGIIFGTGFAPFRGGPLHYIEQTGRNRLAKKMDNLHKNYGERFQIDESWLTSEERSE